MPSEQPFAAIPTDFGAASRRVVEFLHAELGMGLWMVTRVAGDDWVVLACEDHGYGIAPGDVFAWSDSFCSRMVRGEGPRLATHSQEVAAYREAPIGRQVPIGSYLGVPLQGKDGELFGTLCAIDPQPRPDLSGSSLALVELLADLLGGLVTLELEVAEAARASERVRHESAIDALTGVGNRRAWETVVAAEEDRCRRHGNRGAVLAIDVDGLKDVNDSRGHAAGDQLLCRCADAVRAAVRSHDVVARLGGDEFAVLAIECDEAGAAHLEARIADAFEAARISASIGVALRAPTTGLKGALEVADARMYEAKAARRLRGARVA